MVFRVRKPAPRCPGTRCPAQSILPLYAMLFAMQGARSMYIVLVSWLALQRTGDLASVGKNLICWQFLAFTLGPFVGPLIDRSRRRMVFALGEAIHGAGVGLLAVIAWTWSPQHTPVGVLYATACFISIGSLLSYPSSQALIQLVGARSLARTVSVSILSGQVGNVVGAGAGGLCLAGLGMSGGLALCATSSFLAMAFANLLNVQTDIGPTHSGGHLQDLVAGLRQTLASRSLRSACLALLLAYASAHASNALLAGFVRSELALPSTSYGWLAAMYSGGGLIASVTLAFFSGVVRERILISLGTVVLAAATAALSTAQTMAEAVLWQALIGLAFTMVRAGSDVTLLKALSTRMVGRVRSNIDAAIGLVAMLVYLVPTLAPGQSARQLFLALAGVLACGSGAVLWMQRARGPG